MLVSPLSPFKMGRLARYPIMGVNYYRAFCRMRSPRPTSYRVPKLVKALRPAVPIV